MVQKVSQFFANHKPRPDSEEAVALQKLEELYNKKLWHQVTLETLKTIKLPYFSEHAGSLRSLYDNFVTDFEHRINPLALMEIALYCSNDIPDPTERIAFITKMKTKVKDNKEAMVLAETGLGNIYIMKRELPEVKKIIESTQTLLDELDGVTSVHSRFYELTSDYYKLMGDHACYYREALRFLGCIELKQLPTDRQKERAYSLCLAALLGEGIYNFGELLAHPILETLLNGDKNWIVDLLYAFNSGDINKFETNAQWRSQPDLKAAEVRLRQKICLLCLMEMTFTRPSNNRRITFQEIAMNAKLPVDEVELLVMKALSLGLVKGTIDQVDESVTMTWVQPRVLDLNQIATMQKRVTQWCEEVKTMEMLVENKAHDILT